MCCTISEKESTDQMCMRISQFLRKHRPRACDSHYRLPDYCVPDPDYCPLPPAGRVELGGVLRPPALNVCPRRDVLGPPQMAFPLRGFSLFAPTHQTNCVVFGGSRRLLPAGHAEPGGVLRPPALNACPRGDVLSRGGCCCPPFHVVVGESLGRVSFHNITHPIVVPTKSPPLPILPTQGNGIIPPPNSRGIPPPPPPM